MDHHAQQAQRSTSTPGVSELHEETASPLTELVEDSLSSTNESLTSPPHHSHPPPPHTTHFHRNPPASLPVQSTFERSTIKHPLQHQISTPVTATEVASSRRYSRSISKKELIKKYVKI